MAHLKHVMIDFIAVAVLVMMPALGSRSQTPPPTFGDPLPGLTAEQLQAFQEGFAEFSEEETIESGLGPVFNGRSCAGCHDNPAVGGDSGRVETRFGHRGKDDPNTLPDGEKPDEGNATSDRQQKPNKRFDPLERLGGSLLQRNGIGPVADCTFEGEVVPAEANVVAGRKSTQFFGGGLVEVVTDDTLKTVAAKQPDTIRGSANRVFDPASGQKRIGRFGHKAQVATLDTFATEAYLMELGITTPMFPEENCPQGDCSLLRCDPVADPEDDGSDAAAFATFMRLLAPPPRGEITPQVQAGEQAFTQIGCAGCHVPTLNTGASPIAALHQVEFHPYSDFLLHKMGALGDRVQQAKAGGREMRTAPLWGLRVRATFLHDGRASTFAEAILAHDGQGANARKKFQKLSPTEVQALLAFLGSL